MSNETTPNASNNKKPAKTCHICQTVNPSDYSFCSNCGSSLLFKKCFNCNYQASPNYNFCPMCGSNLNYRSTPNPPNFNYQPYNYPVMNYQPNYNYPYYQAPPWYNNYQRFFKLHWWNVPVFYLIFMIFGLIFVSEFVAVIILAISGMNLFQLTLQDQIYADVLTKLVQLGIIVLALKVFKGFHFFFSKNAPQIKTTKELKEYTGRSSNYFYRILFVLLLLFLLLMIDLYLDVIMTYLKNLLHLGQTSSAYNFLNTNSTNDVFLIFLWVAVFAPVHEEILFRGILQKGLDRTATSDFSHYIIQGTTFAFMHLAGDIGNGGSIDFIILHMISVFSFAIASTYLRKKFGSLIPSILLHSFSNGLSVLFGFVSTPYLTPSQVSLATNLIYVLPLVFFLAILLFLYLRGQWRLKKPLSFKQEKPRKFIFLILFTAFLFNVLQYAFVFIPNLYYQAMYIIGFCLVSIAIFIVWGVNLHDVSWKTVIDSKKA